MPETNPQIEAFFPNAAIYDEDELAFTAGDIWLIPGTLPTIDPYKSFVWLDQRSEEESIMACTIVGRLNQISWLWGRSPTKPEMLDYIDYATKVPKPSYVIWKWRQTRYGANAARNKWNTDNPTQKVIVITGTIGDDIFREAYQKNHMIGVTYKWNAAYNRDFSKEGILDGKDYKPSTYWHTNNSLSVWAAEGMIWMFDNYDKRLPFNKYSIRYINDLVKNGVFYPTYYLIIPADLVAENPADIVKKKMDRKATEHALYALSSAYDSSTNPTIQAILADAANKIRAEMKRDKDPSGQNMKARRSLVNSLSFLWNFIDKPDIQKDMSELATKVRDYYMTEE